ncbi:MAG TPA: Tol-Pal system beta propeller repeat protein TolB [Terriglobales bacterium]|nr:Tol-Pal system beta propeller repeat protein TolB [Terriglobales bacterium]
MIKVASGFPTTVRLFIAIRALILILAFFIITVSSAAQTDWIRTGTGLGVEKVRLAVPDFKAISPDPQTAQLLKIFNDTLWSDLDNAGIFDMVSKSFYPLEVPGRPEEMKLTAWSSPPPNAGMVAFGNLDGSGQDVLVQGWLYDAKNTSSPQVLGKQYREKATPDNARVIAHRFANEIIFRLGGGIQGITETRIFYVSTRSGRKEIWAMDYDGVNQHQVTHLGSISLSPRVSPDNSRLAFSSESRGGWEIRMWSLDLSRLVAFPAYNGTNLSPAWSSDGTRIAFSSSRTGDPEIYVADADGRNLRRVTSYRGPDVSPVWNPKTNSQIAWVSGRTGLPQIYTMEADGTNVQRMTDQGYAVSPSWSPNGQYLAFAWIRHYGPGAPGASDVYVMDITTKQFVQLTHDAGRNDSPSWSPDGRHIVFQSNRTGGEQIWTMLADGTQQRQLTTAGQNTQPNWSFK